MPELRHFPPLPVWSGPVLSIVSALGAATLTHAGLSVLGAAAIVGGAAAAALWWIGRRVQERVDVERDTMTRELEDGKHQAEAREQLLRALVDATPMALVFHSDTGQIRFANAEARRLFFEGDALEGENFLRLVSSAPEVLRGALLGGTDDLFNVEIDGQRETYHASRRIFDFDGELHTLLLVRQLTFEVSRREVDVLRKVIRIISHELNNSLAPIASLIHSARLVAKNPAHFDKLDRIFDTIEERATHLGAFLNGYAKLARLPKPRPALTGWDPLLARLRSLFPSVRIEPTGGAMAYFDGSQIEQVLINLLKNACESGGDAAAVQLAISPEPAGAVTVSISDRGMGLTAEALESAFLPLYSTKENGSGMGLALCREIAEAHAGRISIRNRDGGGCIVSVWLPGERKSGRNFGTSRATLTLSRV